MRGEKQRKRKSYKPILTDDVKRFETLVETAGVLIVGLDTRGHITLFNKRCEEVTGYSSQEAVGKKIFTLLIPKEERKATRKILRDLASGELPSHFINDWVTKEGKRRTIEWNSTIITDDEGDVREVFGVGIDITERKLTEAQYISLFDSIPVGLYRTTPDGQILYTNKALVEMLGFPDKESMLTSKATDFYVVPEDRERAHSMLKHADVVRGFETRLRRQDGSIIWARDNFRAIKDKDGRVLYYEGSLEEITESKWLQEAYYQVAEHSIQALAIIQDFRIVFANQAMAELLGYTVDEILAWNHDEVKDYVYSEDRSLVWGRYQKQLKGKQVPKRFEFRVVRKDGAVIWVEVFATQIEYSGNPAIQAAYVNINERKQAEKALRESEERYRILFERASDVICVMNLQGRILDVSPAVEVEYGYKPDELIGKTLGEIKILAPEYLEDAVSNFKRLLAGDHLPRPVYEFITKGDTRRVGEVRSALMYKEGKVFAVVIVIRDITERYLAEEALRDSEEKLRAQYKGIPVPTYTWQRIEDGFVLVDYNDAAMVITKGKIPDYLGMKAKEMYRDKPELLKDISRCFTEKTSFAREMLYHYKSTGEKKYLAVKYAFVPPDLVLVHTEDITERKQAEEALRASEEQQRALLKAIPDMIFQLNRQGIFLTYKAYREEDLYIPPNQFLGKNIHDVLPQALAQQTMHHVEQAFLTGEVQRFEYQLTTHDELKDWEARLVVSGEDSVLIIAREITELKQVENILREARSRAEFLVDLMGHDLNNINQGILLNLELLLNDPSLSDNLEDRVLAAISQVDRSAELIGNVKRFQSLDTEPVRLERKDLFLPFFAAADAVERTFPHKKLIVKANLSEGQFWVQADGFLTELFFNLLHNSMKFDRKERVLIDVRVELTRDKGAVRVQIKDRGPGIPDSEKERIFSRFPREQEGVRTSGIGLTLVYRIIQRYGGKIWVEDRIKGDHTKGANFVILFPRREST